MGTVVLLFVVGIFGFVVVLMAMKYFQLLTALHHHNFWVIWKSHMAYNNKQNKLKKEIDQENKQDKNDQLSLWYKELLGQVVKAVL